MRVITSDRAGVGKSLYIKRQIEKAHREVHANIKHCCISIKKQTLPFEAVFDALKDFENRHEKQLPKIYHIDIAYEVWYEVDYFLFNLMCLGALQNTSGQVFRRDPKDLYLVEIMAPKFKSTNENDENKANTKLLHSCLNVLPTLNCLTPIETLSLINEATEIPVNVCPILFDDFILRSDLIQRPCQYLQVLDVLNNFDRFKYTPDKFLNMKVCLELLIKHLENTNQSWSEIINFSRFLNAQLIDSENSIFCDIDLVGDLLPGFKTFVVKFMIQMSHDFALPSLYISDRSALQMKSDNKAQFDIEQLNMRRKWENDPHPYLFFNPDGQTFTFFGFCVDRNTGHLLDQTSNAPLFDNKLSINRNLMQAIESQNAKILKENISKLSKIEKIRKLLSVMGIKWATDELVNVQDPDPSYELTMDNLLKIIAIYMRLRANIPVIIMGMILKRLAFQN